MSEVIIDTNVAVIANHQNSDVAEACRDACIAFLITTQKAGIVIVDEAGEVLSEYAGALKASRPYQLGAQFLIDLYRNQWNTERVRQVAIGKDTNGAFSDFPKAKELAAFDLSDRKFAALSRVTGVPVTNATDTDWLHSLASLNENGVAVEFLCGQDSNKWTTD